MDEAKKKLLESFLGAERLKHEERLTYHTLSKAHIVAECFYIATSQSELISALDIAYQLGIKLFVFGGGSKIVFRKGRIYGLVIKNRTGNIKINGVKGKVGRNGVGIEEAMVEVDSGVSIGRLNEFLNGQKLQKLPGLWADHSTLGGSIFLYPEAKLTATNIKVWERGDVVNKEIFELKKKTDVVLSVTLKVLSAF